MHTETPKRQNIPRLERIDAESYEYPLDPRSWLEVIEDNGNGLMSHMSVATLTVNLDTKAFVIYYMLQESPEEEIKMVIYRLGVARSERRKKYGSILVEHVRSLANDRGLATVLTIVPEYFVDPREERGVIEFLQSQQFSAKRPVLKEYYEHFGRYYDGIQFETGSRYRPELDDPTSFQYFA